MTSRTPQSVGRELVTHVALLRGINVGGKHMLPMASLAEMFVEAGCEDVRTFIQSGNVVFAASAAVAKRVPRLVGESIQKQFGFAAPVIVRTASEMVAAVAGNPFRKVDPDGAAVFVGFLADVPEKRLIAALDPNRSPGDSFVVRGGEIYLHLKTGAAKTKFTSAYLDSRLATTVTVRNWRTVLKLVEMSGQS